MRIFKSSNVCVPAFFALAYGDSCYDGNNGGCSHDCSAGVCSCPPCWTLGDDQKTCQFEAGKAQVTCSATGAEIKIDKCALPGVDPSAINFIDTTCAAAEDSENTDFVKIRTGFSECGSTFAFADEKLTLSNTLMIGKPTVGGRVVGRQYNIDFACSYNNIATASSSINAVNTPFNEVTFDIDSAQQEDLSFTFNLAFYESGEFVTAADLSNGAFQPGSPLFGQIAPAETLPGVFEFSVKKCTVADQAIPQSLDILDICPSEGTNFVFQNAQSAKTSVKFSFESFTFPDSADDAVLDVNCEVNICPENSAECLNLCDNGDSSDSSSSDGGDSSGPTGPKDHLLYIGQSTSNAFVMKSDGTMRAAGIIIPVGLTSSQSYSMYSGYDYDVDNPVGSNFLFKTKSAIVNGQVYFFGGVNDMDSLHYKIVTFNGCELVELEAKLKIEIDEYSSVMTTKDGSEALICWSYGGYPNEGCNTFDGTSAADTWASNVAHQFADLAYYKGKPTTVGSYQEPGSKKVETLGEDGWEYLDDFPINLFGHSLVGLESGDLMVIGGQERTDQTYIYRYEIWRMSATDGSVTKAGDLQQYTSRGSVLMMDNSIFVISRYEPYGNLVNAVQRIELADDESIERTEIVTEFTQGDDGNHTPNLLAVEADFCQV